MSDIKPNAELLVTVEFLAKFLGLDRGDVSGAGALSMTGARLDDETGVIVFALHAPGLPPIAEGMPMHAIQPIFNSIEIVGGSAARFERLRITTSEDRKREDATIAKLKL